MGDGRSNDLDAAAVVAAAAESALLGCDDRGRVTFADERAERLLGAALAELVRRRSVDELVDADELAARAEELDLPPGPDCLLASAREAGRESRRWTLLDAEACRHEVLLTVSAVGGDAPGQTSFVLAVTEAPTVDTLAALRSDVRRYRDVVEHGNDGVWGLDAQGRTIDLNRRMCELLGRPSEEVLDRPVAEFLVDGPHGLLSRLENGQVVTPEAAQFTLRRPDATERWVRLVAVPAVGPDGTVQGTTALVTDDTPSRRAEQELRAQERFRGAFQDAPIAMAVVDVDERFLEVNDALCRLTGLSADELQGRSIEELTVADEPAPQPGVLPVHAATGAGERKLQRADGGTVWVSVHVRLWSAEGQPTRLLLQLTDISERKHYENELRHLGEHDPLTGLANRRQLSRELERHVARVHRHGPIGAVLLLDLDQFKMINDTMGHSAGDRVIVGVATALGGRLRASDILARLGGDEFAVLLPDVDPDQAVRVAEDLANCLAGTRIRLDDAHSHAVTTSVGVATFEGNRVTAEEVLARADAAMYQAKDEGPGRVRRFQPGTSGAEPASQPAERGRSGVLTALRGSSFRLMAQPLLDLHSGVVTHHELLVRLRVGDRMMLPASFLPTAQRHGLVPQIDRWVFSRAVDLLRKRTLGDSVLCVNVDGRSLGDQDFIAEIERDLDPDIAPRLVFEITEASSLPSLQAAHDFMSRVRALGAAFAIDDFGSGFGSLHHLRQLPFDYLKIDGEFVRRPQPRTRSSWARW
jgi:diguanylate cyclase (GGDEF)-like protein/PAS domain S-box-containing protein